ncbi:MAG TPA: M3 family oligoendopeptidase, partial [Phycisphaerales bacterium]|nr:M3 family oligoendopeptidase [Phycisphaerales bacterium]
EAKKKAYLHFVEMVEPELKKISFELDKKIVMSEFAEKLDQKRYGVMLRDLRTDVEIFREENVPLQTEDTKMAQQYEELFGSFAVNFRGEEKTLPQMAKYLEETDRATREEAWRLTVGRRMKDVEKIEGMYEAMVKLRHEMAVNAGYENFVEYTFAQKHRFDYTPEDCRKFHDAAAAVCVPVYREQNRERAKSLGLTKLRPWDLAVDVRGRGPLKPFKNGQELEEKTARMFKNMNAELGELFEELRDGTSLDLESRKGKGPGGYQENRDRQRKPFIFMNAAGLHRDLQTMIHEAGHAFHAMLCKGDPLVHYRHSPIEFAEVASMGMELLAQRSLGEFYSPNEADRARRSHLEEVARILPWIAQIDAFQHWVYTHPEHAREERRAKWLELDAKFGAELDWSGLEEERATMWHRQLHLFCVPLYYIEYGIAQLGALQLWRHAKQNDAEALKAYRRGLALGGSRPLPELFASTGLKFEFDERMFKSVMDEVRGELAKLPV